MSKSNTKRDKKKKSYQTWGVKRILAKRQTTQGEYEYLVEWENWTPGEYQWLPKSRLSCEQLLKKFEMSLLTTPNLTSSAKTRRSSTAASKATKTPAATQRRRSARINKKLDEEKEENDAEEANNSKQPQKRNRVSISSSQDEAPPIKTKKDTTGDDIATETTRVLRKRPEVSPNYTTKRRSAPVKLEATPATEKKEKKTLGTPTSDADDAFFGYSPERVTRSGRPASTGATKPVKKISKSVKEPKRRIVENVDDEENAVDMEQDLGINLEMNNECGKEQNVVQEEAHIDELQHVPKEEVTEPETVSVHENIIAPNVAYNNAQVKEEEVDFDAVDENVVSKEVVSQNVVFKTVADVLHSIANEEVGVGGDKDSNEVDLPKKSDVGDKGVENVDTQLADKTESVDHNSRDMCDDDIAGDPREVSIPDQPNPEGDVMLLPPLLSSAESPSNYVESDDGEIRNKVYEEILASLHVHLLMDELVKKVCVSELLDSDEYISIIGVEKKGNDVIYSLNIAGESFIVGSNEVLNHQKLKDKLIEFWEKRFVSTDAL